MAQWAMCKGRKGLDFNMDVTDMSLRILLIIALFSQLLYFANAQAKSVHTGVVELPQGPVTRISSPNRHWTLIFECPDNCASRKLWIEDSASHTRKLVKEYERGGGGVGGWDTGYLGSLPERRGETYNLLSI